MFGILLPAFAGLIALLTLASAKPVLTAVESPSARDIEIVEPPHPHQEQFCCTVDCATCTENSCAVFECNVFPFSDCCTLWVWPKRDEDGILRAYNSKDVLVEFVNVERVSARVTGTAAQSLDSEIISAGDLELVETPHLVKQQVCCTPGCKWCVSNSYHNVGCSLSVPWISCCSLEVWVGERDEEGLVEAYSQNGELVTWVGADQFSERDVEIVGPPPLARRLCCTSDCESCVGSCETVGCPVWPWTHCCVHPIFGKRGNPTQPDNQKRQLGESTERDYILDRGVEMVGPPRPVREQYCCTIGCRQCSRQGCPNGECAPWMRCCALWVWPRKRDERKADRTSQAYNDKGEMVQFVDVIEPSSVGGEEETKLV